MTLIKRRYGTSGIFDFLYIILTLPHLNMNSNSNTTSDINVCFLSVFPQTKVTITSWQENQKMHLVITFIVEIKILYILACSHSLLLFPFSVLLLEL